MSFLPHHFWQTLDPAGTHDLAPAEGFVDRYPAVMPDARELLLPIRVLPGGTEAAVASLIVNQASFAVEDALADAMAGLARPLAAGVVIGVPTLGLPLANAVARRLGHGRMVPLGTSRKFWYRDELSEPLASITTPGGGKTLYLDPRMLPLLEGRRVVVVDDVVSSGSSLAAVHRLLGKAGIAPVATLVAMEQGTRWRTALPEAVVAGLMGAIRSPRLRRTSAGRWLPE